MISYQNFKGFDFHCHVDLYPSPERIIKECSTNGIFTLAVTTTPKAWKQNQAWTQKSDTVFAAPGLHPELIADRFKEIVLLEDLIKKNQLIGEIGLDGSPEYRKTYSLQKEIFARALIACQRKGQRLISVHSRRASSDVLDHLAEHVTSDRVLPILHWFSGTNSEASRATELGCYFSINAETMKHQRGISLIQKIPLNRLLTETDGPFTSVMNERSKPINVISAVATLSEIRGLPLVEMQEVLSENSIQVLKFAGFNNL